MEGQSSKGTSQHQYPTQSEQWSRLVRRNTLATSTSPFPPSALLHSPQVSTTIETFPDLLPQQTTAYQVQLAQYNKLIASGRGPRAPASPLPPVLSTQHIQAVPRSGSSGFESKQRRISNPKIGHGNKKSHITGTGDRPLIAAEQSNANTANMASKKPEAQKQPARSQQHNSGHAQQSSSVPSTPNQRARKFSTTSRDPSPVLATNHSPRSAYSESNTTVPTYRPLASRLGQCPYETGMAHFKRRMPYKLGCERLEPAKPGTVKTKLNPEEDQKLSKDIEKLYDQLVPTPESEARRRKLIKKLENLLNTEWPGHEIRVHVFGSSGNMLCTDESDVDICITTEWKELERVCMLADLLAKHGMTHINCVSAAKVPIVKVWDPELGLACDMNVNNALALENTRMIKTYVEIDPRVRPLAMIVKHWTKRRIVNDAAYGGTLSSYTWICMIINFLQQRKSPILPSLHQWQEKKPKAERGDCDFADNIAELRNFGQPNKQSLGELLFQFFRFYAHEFDYDKDVVSVRQGKLIDKKAKGWHITNNNGLCVEEPFNTGRNLGNTADDFSVRGLHIELRRAFDLVSEARLDDCCEQYVFPKEEERIWEKPVPQPPRPLVISRSASQTRGSRGGHGGGNGNRGGRHNNNHRNGASSRRASSATTYDGAVATNNNQSQHNYSGQTTHSAPPLASMPQQNESWVSNMSNQQAQNQLHELYMNLEAQKDNLLRLQLFSQEQGFQQSQARIEHFAQSHRQHQNGPITTQHATDRHRGMSFDNPAPSTAPLYYFYPVPFQQPQMYPQQSSSSTYPSSPSLPPAAPELRRSLHRNNVPVTTGAPQQNTMANSAMRSHSQPAARTGFAPYPYQYSVHAASPMSQHINGMASHGHMISDQSDNGYDDGHRNRFGSGGIAGVEKDYKGYSVNGAITYQNPMDSVAQPSTSTSMPSRRRLSTEQFPQAVLERLSRPSRSPSPIGRGPAYSATSRSVPTISALPQMSYGTIRTPQEQIPVVVNGSAPIAISHQGSRGPPSVSGSSGDEFHDALAESFDSLNVSPTSITQLGHAETMGLRASGPYVNGMEQCTNGLMNGHVDFSLQKQPLPKLTTIPSLEHKRSSPNMKSSGNSSHKTPLEGRVRGSKHITGNMSPLELGQRIEQARESQPHLSPVYETRAPTFSSSRKAEGKVNGNHANDSNEGASGRGPKRNHNNDGQKSQPASPARGHTRNSRSEGSSHPSNGNNWSQISNKSHKRKGLGVDRNKANTAHNVPASEELPKRDSDRKGG